MNLKLASVVAFACLAIASATAVVQAGPPCEYCLDRLDRCLANASTPAEESACFSDFRQCRIDICQNPHAAIDQPLIQREIAWQGSNRAIWKAMN